MMRKSTRQSRGPNTDEKRFHAWLKEQPCWVGGNGIVEVHHCKGATFKHNKVLIGHWFCLPLSQSAHSAYHAGTKAWQAEHGNQAEIWESVYAAYKLDAGVDPCPDEVCESIMSLWK